MYTLPFGLLQMFIRAMSLILSRFECANIEYDLLVKASKLDCSDHLALKQEQKGFQKGSLVLNRLVQSEAHILRAQKNNPTSRITSLDLSVPSHGSHGILFGLLNQSNTSPILLQTRQLYPTYNFPISDVKDIEM